MQAIELFAGAGGLGIGVSRAGFHPSLIVERDRWCCDTLRENCESKWLNGSAWPSPVEADIRKINFNEHAGKIVLVSGGPPCQPFSLGGKHRAHADHRDMWSEAVRALREVRPKAFIFENVRGLARQSFADYLGYILLQLQYPSIPKKEDEVWPDHLKRLQQHHTSDGVIEYKVVHQVMDAADYGVPQRRHRIVFVGFRSDINIGWSFPQPTHSFESLLRSQGRGGDYWKRHNVAIKDQVYTVPSPAPKDSFKLPWLTVRDALMGLPDPQSDEAATWVNHKYQPGARTYEGHTGSPVDQPAKALKAGVHGVPGGENMLRRPDGSVRYFTVREAARLQNFPDDWRFQGAWSEAMRQLGNAVPATLGEVVARSVRKHLEAAA